MTKWIILLLSEFHQLCWSIWIQVTKYSKKMWEWTTMEDNGQTHGGAWSAIWWPPDHLDGWPTKVSYPPPPTWPNLCHTCPTRVTERTPQLGHVAIYLRWKDKTSSIHVNKSKTQERNTSLIQWWTIPTSKLTSNWLGGSCIVEWRIEEGVATIITCHPIHIAMVGIPSWWQPECDPCIPTPIVQ